MRASHYVLLSQELRAVSRPVGAPLRDLRGLSGASLSHEGDALVLVHQVKELLLVLPYGKRDSLSVQLPVASAERQPIVRIDCRVYHGLKLTWFVTGKNMLTYSVDFGWRLCRCTKRRSRPASPKLMRLGNK